MRGKKLFGIRYKNTTEEKKLGFALKTDFLKNSFMPSKASPMSSIQTKEARKVRIQLTLIS